MNENFRKFAQRSSNLAGSPVAFTTAVFIIGIWGILGPQFHYSDTWQLIINTSTTIITFLIVFLIQNTQNRESKSLHLKIDELIRATKDARNMMISLDELSDEELDRLHNDLLLMRDQTSEKIEHVKGHKQKRRRHHHSHHHE